SGLIRCNVLELTNLPESLADHIFERVVEQIEQKGIYIDYLAGVRVEDQNAVLRRFKQPAIAKLRCFQAKLQRTFSVATRRSMRCGWKPERLSSLDRAMEKQPPRDAAINSSGLVPMPCRKRVRNEYCVLFSTPLSVVNVPVPCRRVPFQMTEALRSMMENGRNFPEVPRPFSPYDLPEKRPIPCSFDSNSLVL